MRRDILRLVISFLCVWITLGLAWPGTAQAQERIAFNLPSQSLGDALRAVGSQLNINVLFDPTYIEDLPAPAVKTVGTLDDALTLLLRGSGFTHRHLNDNTIVLVAAGLNGGAMQTNRIARAPIAWLRVIEIKRGAPRKRVLSAPPSVPMITTAAVTQPQMGGMHTGMALKTKR